MLEVFHMAGKQVDATRQELFITIRYLLDECYDAEHTSKTERLSEYANERFGVNLDRRRANDILDFLVDCPNNYPGTLPFTIIKVPNKPRYYIQRTLFEKDETKKIAEAIFKDSTLSRNLALKLVDTFLSRVCNQDEAQKIITKLNKKEPLVKRQSERNAKHTISYEMLRDEQLRFTFKPIEMVKRDACSNRGVWSFLYNLRKQQLEDEQYCGGIVYDIYPQGNDVDICIYLPDIHGAVILNINNIKVKPGSRFEQQWNGVIYDIDSADYENIDEMIKAYYKGECGIQYDISFKFNVGRKDNIRTSLIEKRKKEYEDYFSKPMEYELVEREVDYGDKKIIAIDLHSSIRCSFLSFKKWYWDYRLFESLVILSPASFNNRLIGVYARRFQERLEKYGKDPHEEWLEQNKDRLQEIAKRRAERLARRRAQEEANADIRNENSINNDGGN